MGGSTVAELYDIETATKEELQATETQKAEQNAILVDIAMVQTAIDSLFSLLPSPVTDTAWSVIKPQLETLYAALADLKDAYTLLTAPIETAIAEAADDIKADNTAIETSELWEENQKAVNDVWLSTFAKGNYILNTEQLTVIYSVATQCPISGGDAVFQAQSIYRTVAAEVLFDTTSAMASCIQTKVSLFGRRV